MNDGNKTRLPAGIDLKDVTTNEIC